MIGGTHGCISPDVNGTSDCLKYQLVHLMHVHALQQTRRLEMIHDVFYAKLCIYVKVCVTALQTLFICMAFTLNMLLFRSFLIIQPILSLLYMSMVNSLLKNSNFPQNPFTQLHASLTQIHNLKCLSYVKLST